MKKISENPLVIEVNFNTPLFRVELSKNENRLHQAQSLIDLALNLKNVETVSIDDLKELVASPNEFAAHKLYNGKTPKLSGIAVPFSRVFMLINEPQELKDIKHYLASTPIDVGSFVGIEIVDNKARLSEDFLEDLKLKHSNRLSGEKAQSYLQLTELENELNKILNERKIKPYTFVSRKLFQAKDNRVVLDKMQLINIR